VTSLPIRIQAWWKALPKHITILILDWLIVIAIAILMVVIYIPRGIWAEEDAYRKESRRRMQILQDTQEFYRTMGDSYATDGKLLIQLVSQAHDSLIADTTFINDQVIHIDGKPYQVNIPEGLWVQMDTTFSVGRELRHVVLDTIYTITLWNMERAAYDTLYRNGAVSLAAIMKDSTFSELLETTYGSHPEVYTDYAWNRFRLSEELLYCPVTKLPYVITADDTEDKISIASPIEEVYVDSRFIFFKFRAEGHGEIVDGEASWRL
jgi:hypothetical protein